MAGVWSPVDFAIMSEFWMGYDRIQCNRDHNGIAHLLLASHPLPVPSQCDGREQGYATMLRLGRHPGAGSGDPLSGCVSAPWSEMYGGLRSKGCQPSRSRSSPHLCFQIVQIGHVNHQAVYRG